MYRERDYNRDPYKLSDEEYFGEDGRRRKPRVAEGDSVFGDSSMVRRGKKVPRREDEYYEPDSYDGYDSYDSYDSYESYDDRDPYEEEEDFYEAPPRYRREAPMPQKLDRQTKKSFKAI